MVKSPIQLPYMDMTLHPLQHPLYDGCKGSRPEVILNVSPLTLKSHSASGIYVGTYGLTSI